MEVEEPQVPEPQVPEDPLDAIVRDDSKSWALVVTEARHWLNGTTPPNVAPLHELCRSAFFRGISCISLLEELTAAARNTLRRLPVDQNSDRSFGFDLLCSYVDIFEHVFWKAVFLFLKTRDPLKRLKRDVLRYCLGPLFVPRRLSPIDFRPSIYAVQKQVHPDLGISVKVTRELFEFSALFL